MQDLQGLALSDFEKKANIILGKAEVDKDGFGNFTGLENVTDFNIQTNITNLFLKTSAKSFSISLLNTGDKYSLYNKGKSEYRYIKQGRKIKLYIGIRNEEDDYYWSWIYGIIDKYTTAYNESGELCFISGRDYIAYLSENYLKKLWWGSQGKYNIVAEKEKYDMPSTCKGIHKAWLYNASTEEYDELTLNSEYTYDWEENQLVFLHPSVPFEGKTGGLWIYYYTPQIPENVVADLLIEAGLMTHSGKQAWLNNSELVTPTGKTINRVWFEEGTSYIKAIEYLAERAIYRFGVDNQGSLFFKGIPILLSATAKRLTDSEYLIRNIEERLDELYNHFILVGEAREMKKINLGIHASQVEEITSTTAKLIGQVTADGESSANQIELFGGTSIITKKGFKWQEITDDDELTGAEQSWEVYSSKMGLFTHTITGLDPETRYKWMTFTKNSLGQYAESQWQTFVTPEVV